MNWFKRRTGPSMAATLRRIGRAMVDGLEAGIQINKISKDLTEREIETFERKMQGLPIILNGPANISKWDVIARLQYLRNQLGNAHEKNYDTVFKYRKLKEKYESLEKEYDKLEAEAVNRSMYTSLASKQIIEQARIALEKSEQHNDIIINLSRPVVWEMVTRIADLEEKLHENNKRFTKVVEITNELNLTPEEVEKVVGIVRTKVKEEKGSWFI